MIGKLKRSLKERCPECGSILQVRAREVLKIEKGVEFYVYEDYIACSNRNCGYEKEIDKKSGRKHINPS